VEVLVDGDQFACGAPSSRHENG